MRGQAASEAALTLRGARHLVECWYHGPAAGGAQQAERNVDEHEFQQIVEYVQE